jgi:hypothetical protein
MRISREEIFGPVQSITKWSTMDEVGGVGGERGRGEPLFRGPATPPPQKPAAVLLPPPSDQRPRPPPRNPPCRPQRSSAAPTTQTTASPPASSRATWTPSTPSPAACAPAPCGGGPGGRGIQGEGCAPRPRCRRSPVLPGGGAPPVRIPFKPPLPLPSPPNTPPGSTASTCTTPRCPSAATRWGAQGRERLEPAPAPARGRCSKGRRPRRGPRVALPPIPPPRRAAARRPQDSGMGREKGEYALANYTQTKARRGGGGAGAAGRGRWGRAHARAPPGQPRRPAAWLAPRPPAACSPPSRPAPTRPPGRLPAPRGPRLALNRRRKRRRPLLSRPIIPPCLLARAPISCVRPHPTRPAAAAVFMRPCGAVLEPSTPRAALFAPRLPPRPLSRPPRRPTRRCRPLPPALRCGSPELDPPGKFKLPCIGRQRAAACRRACRHGLG